MDLEKIYSNLDYGPAPESSDYVVSWLKEHKRSFDLYIAGKWQKPKPAKYFTTNNPADGKSLAKIAQASANNINEAVRAAKKAQPAWWKIGAHARARYLYAIARQIQKQSRFFAVLESLDNGKPIRESRDIDVPLVARHFYHHAGWAQLLDDEFKNYRPVGVVGQVIPWNFPLLMLAWKIAPALAAGNTVVLKPAEFTSLTALAFAELCQEIGLPAGVVNIVTGDGAAGANLVAHKDVNKVAFTGSTEVGRLIRRQVAGTGKKLSLELGGKSPFIVFDDADLDSAVEGVVDAIWFNQGQVCCAGSRLLVQEGVKETFIDKLKNRMETLRMGDPLDKGIDMGAIIAPVQLKQIKNLVEAGKKEGAKAWQPKWETPKQGSFFPPTLFTNVSPANMIAQEEIFGPVLVTMTFRTPAEAVKLANNTRYGLAASIWSENINLALDIAPKVKAGSVWINSTNMFDAASGFGGYRESGFGREGGREGLFEYLQYDAKSAKPRPVTKKTKKKTKPTDDEPTIDRTAKLYIGGKQVRPDAGYSTKVVDASGAFAGYISDGNRKDIRNAVEAASAAQPWTLMPAHQRAQILYFIAENLSARAGEFTARIQQLVGVSKSDAKKEVEASLSECYTWASWADKYDGNVHHTPFRNVTLAMPEAVGVVGVSSPKEWPLLGLLSSTLPLLAMGNRIVVIPADDGALVSTDFYQVLETSDLPPGAINIVTGKQNALIEILANHNNVDGIWHFGDKALCKTIEHAAAENMKRTWLSFGKRRNWLELSQTDRLEFLRHATEIKNIWIPYGE